MRASTANINAYVAVAFERPKCSKRIKEQCFFVSMLRDYTSY